MSKAPKKRNNFTSIPRDVSPSAMSAVAANIEMLTGQRGSVSQRAVLVEDLHRLGLVSIKQGQLKAVHQNGGNSDGGSGGVKPRPDPVVETPHAPQNVQGNGGFQYASLQWDKPGYVGHANAEIFYAGINEFSSAVRVGVTAANVFSLTLPINGEGYFWVRFINQVGDKGPLHNGNGVHITTAGNIDDLLDQMTDRIDLSHLSPDVDEILAQFPELEQKIHDQKYSIFTLIDEAESIGESLIENALGADYDRENNGDKFANIIKEQISLSDDQQSMAQSLEGLDAGFDEMKSSYTSLSKVVADNDSTSTLRYEELKSESESAQANLKENYYTQASVNSAISSAITSFESTVDDNSAAIKRVLQAQSDREKAVSQQFSELTATVEGNATKISETRTAIADLEKATSEVTNKLESSVESANSKIETVVRTQAEDNQSTSELIDHLTAQVGSNQSSIQNMYKTYADDKQSTSESIGRLLSTVDQNEASIDTIKQTQASADQAHSNLIEQLSSQVDNNKADFLDFRTTAVEKDNALSQQINSLSSEVNNDILDVQAALGQASIARTNLEQASAEMGQKLSAKISDALVGNIITSSELYETKKVVADVNGYQEALWGVKATAGDITASVGLVAKAHANNPSMNQALFVVNNADFRVTYDDGIDENSVTPVFGTINNPQYDPSAPKQPSDPGYDPHKISKKVLVIDTAAIRVANIKNLVSGNIVADEIVSNTTITSPVIQGGEIEIGSNFSVSSQGDMRFKNFVGDFGQLTGKLTVKDSYMSGDPNDFFLYSNGGKLRVTHGGYIYAEDGEFRGTIYAEKIIGDLVSASAKPITQPARHGFRTIYSFTVENNTRDRATLHVPAILLQVTATAKATSSDDYGNTVTRASSRTLKDGREINTRTHGLSTTGVSGNYSSSSTTYFFSPPISDTLAAGQKATYTVQVEWNFTSNAPQKSGSCTVVGSQAVAQLFRDGSAFT